MKRSLIFRILAGLLFSDPGTVLAYGIETHADMSREAAKASVLRDNSPSGVLRTLGLQFPIEEDIKQVFPNAKNDKKSILELFRDGARFEDNFPRSLNHFFDPLNDKGLGGVNTKSPDWALEDKGNIDGQAFSYKRSREYFYDALTKTNQIERDRNFGLTFQTLGQVIHHIQDMAQPQHVRDDDHCDIWPCRLVLGLHNPSRYEKYSDEQREKGKLSFDAYAPVNSKDDLSFLTTARAFWHTQNKNPAAGLGIAEFSNTNFLSAGTNFDTTAYSGPRLGDATPRDDNANNLLEREGLTVPPECLPPRQPCVMTFYRSRVQDNYRSAESKDNDYTSTLSIFDQDLQVQNKRAFSLNRFNFNAAHEFLIPRAVAYSAGLIDYFFRGKLEAEDVTFTDTGITLKVKNSIDPTKTPAWTNETLYAKNSNGSAGSFTVALDYQDSAGKTQYGVSSTVPVRATDTLAPGQISSDVYDFTLTVPSEAKDVNYRLIFRGKLGQEDDAVAVGMVEPVSGFLVTPSYTPADGIGGVRAIFRRGGQWKLDERADLIGGNIDWKGRYVNGRPTKVLSWKGPQLRYFPMSNNSGNRWSNEIFQNGEVVSYAPNTVLGAALLKDDLGKEWIIAICTDFQRDIVYRRPNKKSDTSWETYDPVTNPDGWEEIGRFTPPPGVLAPDRPWFFNGTGTEAQTMRRDNRVLQNGLTRLKIKINADDVTLDGGFKEEGNLEGQNTTYNHGGVISRLVPPVVSCGYWLSADEETSYSVSTQGRYVVAVDYQDQQEILATLTLTASSNMVETYHEVHPRCAGINDGSDTVNGTHKRDNNYRLALEFSKTSLPLIAIALAEESTLDFVSNAYKQRGSLSRDWLDGSLFYLDLRHDLAVVQSTHDVAQGDCSVDVQSTGEVNEILGDKLEIFQAGKTIAVYNETRSIGGPFPSPCYFSSLPKYGSQDPSTSTSGLSPVFPQTIDFQLGSWPVDTNDNLLVSQQYRKRNASNLSVFNYLSGAPNDSPVLLIPAAPANAVYFPAGVIR